MSDTKKIVILGAGYAGVEAAKVLNKKFKKDNNVEITLINSNPYHTLLTELHEIAGQRTHKESVMVDLYSIFKATKVNVVRDTVNSIDYKEQVLTSEQGSYKYDYLVLGCGAEPAFFGVEGVQDNAFTIWSLKDALKIRTPVESMFEKARDEKDVMKRRDLLSIIVAGAGFTGVEVVGELFDLKKVLCQKYDINEDEVTLYNVEAMPNILPMLRPALQAKATNFMKKKKVDVMTNAAIVKATPDGIVLKDGREIKAKTLIWTCGVQGNSFVPGTGITPGTGKRNRIQVNDFMQSMDYTNVYAIGDNAWYEIDGKPIPQVVETAIQTGECAAHNIHADITKTEKKKFVLNIHGFMVSVGSHYCVAELMGVPMSGFIAMAMKHLVNLHYLWGVGGLKLIWNYLLHEFFHMENNRSFVGGHLSHGTNTAWLVLLRIYVGVLWLIEGIKKVQEGWLVAGNIKIVQVAGTSGASATEATEQAANAVVPILAQPPAFYQWFTDAVVAPNAGLFQFMVVFMEIGIGLALIAGLFTFFASIASLGLVANFVLSAMTGWDILWFVFAAIALMGGSGGAFSLDYYVQPWIKKWWKNRKFAQTSYLYFD
ncbi:MAG: NADH dehydrogenase [Clostridiales bacterium GWB2_37_7]|nr:MAG: NADH dehydrogenase [Clostridiales bacterium GWB2_37_7]